MDTKSMQEKLNEAVVVMNKSLQVSRIPFHINRMTNKSLQDINIQNMNVELVAQMFKNYQSNVLFHLEGKCFSYGDVNATADDVG
jgi:DASH complex subunit DAD4